jgi:predicted alpha/beta-hydrolase family hydrolase
MTSAKESESVTLAFAEAGLSALWDGASDPVAVAVVAHGAMNDMRHPFFVGVAEGLAAGGVSALRFNFPYTDAGRRYPDRPPVLFDAFQAALDEATKRAGGLPVVAGGKSMGGRMASMMAAKQEESFPATALVFFGYPLHAPGKPDQRRDEHLPKIRIPMLFIQGTSDSLARFDLMEDLVGRLAPLARMHAIEGGDHSFRVRGAKRPDLEIGRDLGAVAARFVAEVVG